MIGDKISKLTLSLVRKASIPFWQELDKGITLTNQPLRLSEESETLAPFDRRGENRAASQWVRTALTEQAEKIDQIAKDVQGISAQLQRSWQQGKPETHWDEHELFKEREAERQRLEAKRLEKEAEYQKFWAKIKADIISYALKAAGLFIVGVIVLGSQAKFKEWVQLAIADAPKQEAAK